MDGELSNDERSNSTEDNFVSEVYNITLDKTIMMIDKRYSNADHILKNLTFFSPDKFGEEYPKDIFKKIAQWLTTVNEENLSVEFEIFKNYFDELNSKNVDLNISKLFISCQDAEDTENSDDDIQTKSIEKIKKSDFKMVQILKLLCKFNLESAFPNLYTVYKAICTLPPTSATAKRTFSKLKLIKTKHRSVMGESRLDHLMVLSCSPDIDINKEKAIDRFAMKSKLLQTELLYQ